MAIRAHVAGLVPHGIRPLLRARRPTATDREGLIDIVKLSAQRVSRVGTAPKGRS